MTTGTATDGAETHAGPANGQRWTARAAFAAMLAAVVVLVASAGPIGLTLVVGGLLGTVAILSAGSGSSPITVSCGGSVSPL